MIPFVIAVCHEKGGVAKTTTTFNLAASLVERGSRTLMIDLDPQANLTSSVEMGVEEPECSIAEVLFGEKNVDAAVYGSSVPELDLLPSGARLFTAGRELHQVANYEHRLRTVLEEPCISRYDVVIVDCPPSLSSLTINALTAADLLIIPTQCEYYSIQALNDMFEAVNLIRQRTNPRLVYRLLVTMFDGRGTFHTRMFEQLQGYFKEGLLQTKIGFDTKLREAQLAGQPITVHAPQSRGAQHYRQLAEELNIYVSTKSQTQAA